MNIDFEKFIKLVQSYNPEEIPRVKKAYEVAKSLHEGQYRQSGEEYISHPLNVAYILATMSADGDTLCAGLLHDTLEDTKITYDEMKELFGESVANLVEGVSKFKNVKFNNKEAKEIANNRKLLASMILDARVIIIKLADRLHNMRTLEFKSFEKQKENSLETQNFFAPLAGYLGAYQIRNELEDLSFKFINPDKYYDILDHVNMMHDENENILNEMSEKIDDVLKENGINANIIKRGKNLYGIYRELEKGISYKDIHDLIALKIIVNNIKECYETMGLVHSLYVPNNFFIKDHIAQSKTNGYEALHTTVFGPNERMVQTRIKTPFMDQMDTNGVITYWALKKEQGKAIMQSELENHFRFFKSLDEINTTYVDDMEFYNQMKKELFSGKIYVFNSNGSIIELPTGATVIDFAYAISENTGKHLYNVLINGIYRPLNTVLHNGDRVKIITNREETELSSKWYKESVTTKVRKRVLEERK